MKKIIRHICLILSALVTGCVGMPENVTPVDDFDIGKYLGRWYEIARLDHSFERELIKVTADYTSGEDNRIIVLNRGFDPKSQKWKEIEGKGYLAGDPSVGRLKVSFFGPFYGGYNIIELDRDEYQYALVCGPNKSYLWILARDPMIDREIVNRLVSRAMSLGFDTERLIYVEH
ncbi:lipocalin family protein [Thermodesulfobacteriota bacterium]